MDNKEKQQNFKPLMIPVVIINGIGSGIISVITAYLFKPVWNKITGYISNERKIN
jgi:hypothetical protein